MKWPERVTLIRHDESAYNRLRKVKDESPLYSEFKTVYNKNPESDEARRMALELKELFTLDFGDHNTPLAEGAGWQAEEMAMNLKDRIKVPDVIFVSPYERTHRTLERMMSGWPELKNVKVVEEERIREQDHGLALIYNDWRILHVLHPEQRELNKIQGKYWYRFPNGENIPDVRERLRSWTSTLTRDFAQQEVMSVSHHIAILAFRSNMERLSEAEYHRLDEKEKPINAGVTLYKGNPDLGQDGRLILEAYNVKLYSDNEPNI